MTQIVTHVQEGETETEFPDGAVELTASHIFELSSPPTTIANVLSAASASPYNVPQRGEAHPVRSDALCIARNVISLTTNQFRIACKFRIEHDERPGGLHAFAGGQSKARTNRDIFGTLLQTRFTYPEVNDEAQGQRYLWDSLGKPETQQHEIEVQIPSFVLRWTRVTTDYGVAVIRAGNAMSSINSSSAWGTPAGTLLCTRADVEPLYGGLKWREVYEFAFRLDAGVNEAFHGWREKVVHQRTDTRDPVNPNDAAGLDTPEIWAEKFLPYDFNQLGLTLP